MDNNQLIRPELEDDLEENLEKKEGEKSHVS